jgi:hypothetical protein
MEKETKKKRNKKKRKAAGDRSEGSDVRSWLDESTAATVATANQPPELLHTPPHRNAAAAHNIDRAEADPDRRSGHHPPDGEGKAGVTRPSDEGPAAIGCW